MFLVVFGWRALTKPGLFLLLLSLPGSDQRQESFALSLILTFIFPPLLLVVYNFKRKHEDHCLDLP